MTAGTSHDRSPLPQRMRSRLSAMSIRLSSPKRALQRHPEVIAAERAAEDAPAARLEDVPEAEPADTPSARESG